MAEGSFIDYIEMKPEEHAPSEKPRKVGMAVAVTTEYKLSEEEIKKLKDAEREAERMVSLSQED
ncbi:MAG: hypothetical protein PHQ86_09780, partial [Dehalococcoidales bacterium]|nr:hypothetical protein [Dehalococcoidales bacterium]